MRGELVGRLDSHGDQAKILFVEDDPSVAAMYRMRFELDGYAVDVAEDGLSALEKARSMRPDVIFLDIRLPKLDGIGFLEALRNDARTKELRVIILSNWNEPDLVDRAASLGALDHLIKSQTTPASLAKRLKELLGD